MNNSVRTVNLIKRMKIKPIHYITLLLILCSCKHSYVKQNESFTHFSPRESTENEKTKNVVTTYKVKVDAETEKVIAISTSPLTKDKEQSELGNFVCDALLLAAKNEFKNKTIDVCLVNRGGLRTNLPQGQIKVVNIFELMPFDNELVLVTISGEKLLAGVETILEKKHSYLGLDIKVKGRNAIHVTVNGEPIAGNRQYNIATSDYLANGGDSFNFFKDPIALNSSNLKIRNAIINYCVYLTRNGKQITPYTDGRLEISE